MTTQTINNYKINSLVKEEYEQTHLQSKVSSAFILHTFEKEGVLVDKHDKENILFLFIEGEFTVSSNYFESKQLKAGEMITIPQAHPYEIRYGANAKLLMIHFDMPTSSHAKSLLHSIRKMISESSYQVTSLNINEPLEKYIDLLKVYIRAGDISHYIYDLKIEEFFLLMRWFYQREELAHFFYPMLKHACSFRRFILENYSKMNNVADMIRASNMSKSVFYERFKKEFGVTAKQWIISKLKERIRERASEPGMTAKDLMLEFNFSSPEHLNAFCKKQFGLTPTDLIKTQRG